MDHKPCRERLFTLELSRAFLQTYAEYLHWYRHLLERLGKTATSLVWEKASCEFDDRYLKEILSHGWSNSSNTPDSTPDAGIAKLLVKYFPEPIQSVSRESARQLVDQTTPIPQIKEIYPSLAFHKEITTYDALHLTQEGLALIAESLIDGFGKTGELIAYDILAEEIGLAGFEPVTVVDFIKQRKERFANPQKVRDMYSAGLEVELVRASDTEIVNHVHECEWARYYRERHPQIGYLMSCSRDNAAYRAMNHQLRLQRTSTLMEDGSMCDFRIHAVPSLEAGED